MVEEWIDWVNWHLWQQPWEMGNNGSTATSSAMIQVLG